MKNFLLKPIEFKFQLKVYQIYFLALGFLYLPYVGWEVFWYVKVGSAAIKWHTWLAIGVLLFSIFLLPYNWISVFRSKFFVFIFYVGLCISIGEIHPFTKVPMYTSFQKEITIYSMTDDKGNFIPFYNYTSLSASQIMHKKSALFERYNGKVPDSSLQHLIQANILEEIQSNRFSHLPQKKLVLVANRLFLKGDSIKLESTLQQPK